MSNEVTSVRATVRRSAFTPWLTVAVLAAAMAYADGFWLTSLQGAIGSVARARGPFQDWLRVSTVLLPIFAVAVHKALARGRRRYGPRPRTTRAVLGTALLVALAGSVVGIGALVANSAYEYNLQANELQLTRSTHAHTVAADQAHSSCDATCIAQHKTLVVHVRGVAYASGIVVVTNLLLVGWVVALQGGRIEGPKPRHEAVPVTG